ncbi:MAG: AAA family ATPase [Thermoproteales archaeon]|nr:AAA family ATPase [Thermoproteales archaeon]
MWITIGNFKSIGRVKFNLAPLTILLGPPASGKSNILDAIAAAGYFNRLLFLDKEYDGNALNLERPALIARFDEHQNLFKYHNLSERILIDIANAEARAKLEFFYEGGKFNITLNNINIPWDFKSLPSGSMENVRSALNRAKESKALIEARLYGYDRYGLATIENGFHKRLKELGYKTPKSILGESGKNAPTIIRNTRDVIIHLNEVLRDHIDEEVEIRVLRSGAVTIFDYGYEVEATAVSDSILRILYYLMALRSAANYVKRYGLENRFILLLEEPIAHVFPFFLDLLAEYVVEATKVLFLTVTTHNPLLVSKLWDKVEDVKTYYVFRDRDKKGLTNVVELNIERLAEDLKTAEDVLYMSPNEVVEKYSTPTQ